MEDHVMKGDKSFKRVRASERAITAALNAIKAAGLPVEKLCVNGGQVEIVIHGVEAEQEDENHGGLKDW